MRSGDYYRAVALLRGGLPVPVDVIARLVEEGYDFSKFEGNYNTFPFFNSNDTGVDTNGE